MIQPRNDKPLTNPPSGNVPVGRKQKNGFTLAAHTRDISKNSEDETNKRLCRPCHDFAAETEEIPSVEEEREPASKSSSIDQTYACGGVSAAE